MFAFIKSMSWFIKKNWYRYIFVVFFGLLLTILNLLPAKIIANLTNGIEQNTLTYDYLIYSVLIPFLVVVVLIYLVATTKRFCQNRLTTTLYYALHQRYMESILAQDATFFERFQAGDLLTRALGDINTVKFSGGNRLLNIFVESMSVVFTFIAMCLINLKLAIFCFLPLSVIFFSNYYLRSKVQKNWKLVREKNSLMGNVVLESITNVRTIRAFSKEEENLKKNLKYSEDAYLVEKENLKIESLFQPMFQTIVAVSMIICYGFGAYLYSKGEITSTSSLVQFAMYLALFQNPLTNIGNMLSRFYQSLISADRLNEVYNSKSLIIDKIGEEIKGEVECIEYKNFSFQYEDDPFNSVENINLIIHKGDTIGIVGKTGSGKSTLIRQLVRQMPTISKGIYINDREIESYQKEDIRRHISYVPQEHVLFSRSVKENVRLGKINATDDEINEAIRLADFEKDISNLSNGLDTIVGEYGVTLSGGQKQRLAIARAFLKDSDVLVLDDSLSAVDGETEANIIKSLKEYRSNKTNIIVAHRLSAVVYATKIIVLANGKIIEEGTHDELMKKKGWYYKHFLSQQVGGDNNE